MKRKIVSMVIAASTMCLALTGCGGENGKKYIKTNSLTGSITFSKVNFYDFFNEKRITNYSNGGYAFSDSIKSTEIWFTDNSGTVRVICVDKALTKKPAKAKVYQNHKKSSYETYDCIY